MTVLLAAAGGVSFLLTMSDAGDGYENRPVFEGLTEKLNDVEKVVLTSAEGELSFFKEDGVWKLEGEPWRRRLSGAHRPFSGGAGRRRLL